MSLPSRIVIVEDEAITQRYLQEIFDQYDTSVVGCFDSAADFLAQSKEMDYDMILMDINIKGPMDGIQLARKVLEKRTVPIVFITAHNDDETIAETLELSPYGFICKPFSGKDVIVTTQIAYKQYQSQKKDREREAHISAGNGTVVISETYTYVRKEARLYQKGDPVGLTKNQHLLVRTLAEHIGRPISYEILQSSIWGEASVAESALRTLVYSVKKILPDLPIVSQSKVGYMLKELAHDTF